MPSLVQVLDGESPTNTAAIRVDTTPGAIWRYSGGGFTIMQQMVIDVTGQPFPQYMQQTVLGPIGMTSSSFEQPQPPERARLTAAGYYSNRSPVRGRWHLYPEMAAAGSVDDGNRSREVRDRDSGDARRPRPRRHLARRWRDST